MHISGKPVHPKFIKTGRPTTVHRVPEVIVPGVPSVPDVPAVVVP